MSETIKPSQSGKMLDTETWDAFRAAGVTEDELLADQPFGPMIFSYTRAQAIEDGVLVDLMQHPTPEEPEANDLGKLVREAGFTIPLAMTATAFSEAVRPLDDSDLPSGQSVNGRLWDVLMMLRFAIRRTGGKTDRVNFQVSVDTDGTGEHNKTVHLWSLVGPGDTPAPVITIMLEGED